MSTSKGVIRGWLERGQRRGATHVILVCDTWDWTDHPVFVMPNEDARAIAIANNGPNMTRLMEVYDLSKDLDAQMAEHRAMNLLRRFFFSFLASHGIKKVEKQIREREDDRLQHAAGLLGQ